MSVTFTAATSTPDHYRIICSDGQERDPHTYATFADAEQALTRHYPCPNELCAQWEDAAITVVREAPELNLANANAAYVLDTLGYTDPEQQISGCCDAVNFLGRVLTALALAPADAGRPAMSMHGDDLRSTPLGLESSRNIDCGRRPGYLQDQLHHLHDLAQWAVLHGQPVVWA